MDNMDLERLGLNRNEARVYYALLVKGEASAQELVKSLGVYRNIVYDNLEKLMEKGLVSFVNEGAKRKFIAEKPQAIIEFLESKKEDLDSKIETAKNFMPQINEMLRKKKTKQEVTVFRGVPGLKKVLSEIVQVKESWCIGVTNNSVDILGETYWKNYNLKKKESKTNEWLLWNSDFENTVINQNSRSKHRVLPRELDQVTETIMYNDKVAIFVFSLEPIVLVIENREIFDMFRKQFEFLWKLSKGCSTFHHRRNTRNRTALQEQIK
ncbi:MAG: helix-turn-helix domain-containing protein [archaeon]